MRRNVSSIVLVLIAVSCGGEPPAPVAPAQPPAAPTAAAPPPAPPTDSTPPGPPVRKTLAELQRETGKAWSAAFAAGDAKKLAGLYAEKAVFKMAGMPDMVGRDAIEKGAAGFFAGVSKIKLGESRVFVKKDVVVSEWVMNGTHSGDFMGHKGTEKPVGWVGATVMWFDDDGHIKEEHTYWNPATMLFQIGASKEKNRGVPPLPTTPQVVIAEGTPAEDENVKTLHQINETWEKKDEKKWLAMLTDKVEWDDITMAEPARGKAAVQKYFKTFSTAFPDAKLATTNAWGAGSFVIEEGTYAGTNTGPLYGAPATKRSMTLHELNVVELDKDHKIVKAVTYGNDLEMMSQLVPPPAPKPDAKPAGGAKPDAKPAPAPKK